jgi:cation:H+ antiporter
LIDLAVNVIILLFALIILLRSADFFIESASSIARRLGVSELLISLTLVALGTSLPELGVAVFGSLGGYPELVISSIMGSAIFNVCVAVGIVALLVEVKVFDKQMIFRDCAMLLATYLLLYIVIATTGIDAVWGVIFLLFYLFYLLLLYSSRRKNKLLSREPTMKNDLAIAAITIIGIAVGAHFTVDSAVAIATILSLPQWLIGATILAAGTSLPELVVSIMALKKGKFTISIGNAIGSNTFDILVGLGVAGVITPITPAFATVLPDFLFLFAGTMVLTFAALTRYRISWKGGFVLILIYISYIFYLLEPQLRWA